MGLLTRNRPAPTVDDSQMSIVEHLSALRRAMAVSAVAWLVASIACWFVSIPFLQFVVHRGGLEHALVYFSPAGGVLLRLQVSLFLGTLVASPIIIWQGWWFVAPGLHMHERRVALPLIFATSIFFLMGVSVSFYSLPIFLTILQSFSGPSNVIQYLPNGSDLLSFLLWISIAFGIVFELPVVLYVLGLLGIISSGWLWRKRVWWIVGLLLASNFMTPGVDPITPLIVAVPLLCFYFGAMLVLKLSGK
ncbi:MAG: twin-arginine translocase subunit TatC [Candidatus Dormibacteraeota bacterium]|nr:twin-arginine translocase subunit TatC [Candidatus Dormibacteraeota bacterium]